MKGWFGEAPGISKLDVLEDLLDKSSGATALETTFSEWWL